ncbi:MAG: hypothetical protein JXB88_23975 [Spirochaetales bacterium]|nr:hypothetical protein [Spirochaetales bacterium]
MLFWLIAGVAIGYFFKPQLDKVVVKVIKLVRDTREKYKNKEYKDKEYKDDQDI